MNRNAITSEYYGPFLVMMEAVLAPLRYILHELGRPPIAEPVSAQARGKFIVRVLAKNRNQNLILQALAFHARRAPGTLPAD